MAESDYSLSKSFLLKALLRFKANTLSQVGCSLWCYLPSSLTSCCGWKPWTLELLYKIFQHPMLCLPFQANKNTIFCLYKAWMDMSLFLDWLLEAINYKVDPCFSMFSCSIGGSASLPIRHPLSPLIYFSLVPHSLLRPPALCWPSNPLQHLASGPLGAGQRVSSN